MQKYFLVFLVGITITLLILFGWKKVNDNKLIKQPINIKTVDEGCYVQGCHGLDIQCGSSKVEACDEMYQLGDGCRQLAKCEIIDEKCEPVLDRKFNDCKTCVQNCEGNYDPTTVSECESSCFE